MKSGRDRRRKKKEKLFLAKLWSPVLLRSVRTKPETAKLCGDEARSGGSFVVFNGMKPPSDPPGTNLKTPSLGDVGPTPGGSEGEEEI